MLGKRHPWFGSGSLLVLTSGVVMRVKFLVLLFVPGKFASFPGAAHRPEGRFSATRLKAIARHGMVAATHPLAVLVGV